MMRNKTSSSMQKTYDECYLTCSTAIYFEAQNNEAEALRSWRSALDQIYYHNAYRVPPNYRPKSETEKALQDSLKDMEMQCKERVDLLEALRQSREEAKKDSGMKPDDGGTMRGRPSLPKTPKETVERSGYIRQGTVPVVNYPNLSKPVPPPKPAPPLPQRPALGAHQSSESHNPSSYSVAHVTASGSSAPYSSPSLAAPPTPKSRTSRTPSPEKRGHLLTTLRANRDGKRPSKSPRASGGRNVGPPAASKAAGLAWDSISRSYGNRLGQSLPAQSGSTTTVNSMHRDSSGYHNANKTEASNPFDGDSISKSSRSSSVVRPHSPFDSAATPESRRANSLHAEDSILQQRLSKSAAYIQSQTIEDLIILEPPTPPIKTPEWRNPVLSKSRNKSPGRPKPQVDYPSYRSEYPTANVAPPVNAQSTTPKPTRPSENASSYTLPTRQRSPQTKTRPVPSNGVTRRPVPAANISTPRANRQGENEPSKLGSSDSGDENTGSSLEADNMSRRSNRKKREAHVATRIATTPPSTDRDSPEASASSNTWEDRVKYIQKHLPKGVDENAAKQIFNEIVVRGDEVHWDDVAGLDIAKNALKEAVVYPFLRPDLFMGLREPARGMLLFGPPGTGKTMLARAVATESRSTFFAISASSLTSKWLGESEKLVRALFSLAKALAPSIIFVDEIDSLLSSRGGSSEHESTRRIKTEFLIQWSDLQRAAAGREQTDKEKKEGDASRVLVLAASNLPWAIDEAARRRFVRRQYIPLPEAPVRATQLTTLLGHQKHSLDEKDIQVLVELTEGFSGSDITALAKDAAMGPLRSLGEALLRMSMDDIRPIGFEDFEASLVNIRPSVSKQGLKEFEDWAKEFGERGG